MRRRHGRLFWRVYLHGVALLVLVGIAVAGVGWAFRGDRWGDPAPLMSYAAEKVDALAADPPRLQAELREVRARFGIEATVYAPDGAVLASTAAPPLAPEAGGHGFLRVRSVALPGGRGRLVVAGARAGDPRHGVLFLGAVLVALALASIPLARSIAAPLERLTAAARALGEGRLSERANLHARGEVGDLGRAFDEMAGRLERLVRGERELLANVSHELRTPLARVRVALELAAEGDPGRARHHLAGIAGDVAELERLVDALLATARLDASAGGLPLRRERVDVAALLADLAARFRAQAPGRELALEVSGPLPAVDGDRDLLRRLVENLLDNARKYSEPHAPVALAARADGARVVVEVRDRGIGIDAADLPRLFTPFFRTDRSRARGTGGVGLGLALARRIAEAHGGTLAAESAPGAGTTLRLSLPAAP